MKQRTGKRLFTLTAALGTAALLAVGANAAFEKTQTFTPGIFSDVPTTEWYAGEVQSTYELGLMNGIGGGIFSPEGNVTVAEAITMAARAAALNAGETIDTSVSGEWYAPYVAYAKAKGFVKDGEFDNFERNAKRYEVAKLFAGALPDGYFTAQNEVARIPDVADSYDYHDALMTLYRAGVVMGSDAYGNFRPEDNIIRAEAAAIINRVALPENRLTKKLDVLAVDDAYTLVYNTSYVGSKEGINSGWVLDNRGGVPRTALDSGYGSLADISDTDGTAMIRDLNKVTTGVITVETNVTLGGSFDGFSVEFRNESDAPVYKLFTEDGAWKYLNADGTSTTVMEDAKSLTRFTFRILIDLDNNRSTTYINKENYGTYPLALNGEAAHLKNFRFATSEASRAVASFGTMKMTANYAVNEDFSWFSDNQTPYDWTGTNAVSSGGSLRITEGTASKAFTPVSGTVISNIEFNLDKGQPIAFAVKSGEKAIVTFTSDDTNFYANGVKVYDNYVKNLWYRIRIEAKTLEQKAVIWLNGRQIGTVDFAEATTSIDNIALSNTSADTVLFDNVLVFEKVSHDDYVPTPVKPAGEEKYTVGLNICSLWHNGVHFGWSCISAYPDAEPVLGYYDEGIPETADWEIKYMVEHGIDFQAFCWYADNTNAPIRAPRNAYQLHDGYMYAEYSDAMKYCLIWECANAGKPKDMDAWKNYYVPYFIENYFKDERYMTLDNQLLLCIFGGSKLADSGSLGSADAVKEAFAYLEDEVKKLGFDGMIYLNCGSASDSLANMGFDGAYAYNWGNTGYRVDVNKNSVLSSAKNTSMYTVPTISVGFNSIPWHGVRYPMMTPEDFKTAQTWVRDEYMPSYAKKQTWQDNFTMISTWNEYGEGTYIMPSAGNGGFGYLDALREVYTDEKADENLNTVPTAAQRERINHLYPQDIRLLRKTGYYNFDVNKDELTSFFTIDYSDKTNVGVSSAKDVEHTADGLRGVVNGDTLVIKSGLSIKAADSPYIRVTLDVPKGTRCEIFFVTDKDKSWTGAKGTSFVAEEEGAASYLVNMSNVSTWKDTVTALRVDPGQCGKDEGDPVKNRFLLIKTEFLTVPARASRNITINGQLFDQQLFPEESSAGDFLIAFDPKIALDYRLNAFHRWDAAAGKLTLLVNHHEVVYTVGSSAYTLDGATKNLGFELYLQDGLPMIPIEKLCADIGYKCTINDKNEPVIETTQKDYFDAVASRTPGEWEFETPGDTEGWSSTFMSLLTNDGAMTATSISTSTDPTITLGGDVNLTAERYKAFEVRVRYKFDSERDQGICMYFTTDSDGTMKESMSIKANLKSHDSGDEWETYTVDLTENTAWRGTIKKLRFDPFNAVGTMEIDYMRFIPDENYEERAKAPVKFEVKGGDAESGVGTFFSNNGIITTVEDPAKMKSGKVFLVTSKAGKNWTYFRQNVRFNPGKTYKIEFDVKLAGLADEIASPDPALKTTVIGNMRYTDAEGKVDHVVRGLEAISVADGWQHFTAEYTVPENLSDHSNDQFAIFADPVGDRGVSYYLDNVTVTEVE